MNCFQDCTHAFLLNRESQSSELAQVDYLLHMLYQGLVKPMRLFLRNMNLLEECVNLLTLKDEAKATGKLGVHSLSDIASNLAPAFLKDRGLKPVPNSISYGYTASGYGYVQDMPYAYVHEFIRTTMSGKIQRFKGGYMNFWQKLRDRLTMQFCWNTGVISVRRTSVGIVVNVKDADGNGQIMEFDKIIISGSFPFKNGNTYRAPSMNLTGTANECLDWSMLEKELFSKVQTIDYYTTVLRIKGLDHIPKGFHYFEEFMVDPTTLGNPVAMARFYGDTNIFLFLSYGNSSNIRDSTVTELAIDAVRNMEGEDEKVILQSQFKYFTHVNSQTESTN